MKPNNYVFYRIIFALIVSLVLIIWPDTAADYLVMSVGVLFLIPGLIALVGYYAKSKEAAAVSRFPIAAVGSLLFGFWLVIMPGFFAGMLMLMLGFTLLAGGIQQLYALALVRRQTTVPFWFYILPGSIFLSGLFVLIDPFGVRDMALMIIGITGLVYALSDLIHYLQFVVRKPKV